MTHVLKNSILVLTLTLVGSITPVFGGSNHGTAGDSDLMIISDSNHRVSNHRVSNHRVSNHRVSNHGNLN